MPKVDISKAAVRTSTNYPPQFHKAVAGREKRALGNLTNLTQFGVNLTTLKPGAASALRHWHELEDEFIYILEGEAVLVEDGGETLMKAGDAAGFKAGVPDAHQLINKSQRDVLYLEIGSRFKTEIAHYPDDDLALKRDEAGKMIFTRKSGESYPS
jgi:uncharacterized cupin superfamily protein